MVALAETLPPKGVVSLKDYFPPIFKKIFLKIILYTKKCGLFGQLDARRGRGNSSVTLSILF
jgi:hypothetical protein